MTKVLYPGSFDPITKGHMNIIEQAAELFDTIYVAVMINSQKKNPFFSPEERVKLIKDLYQDYPNIKIVTSTGAAVDLASELHCKAMIRGLRGVTDFDNEIQLASINRKISNPVVNTVCLFADEPYKYISSSMVKELYYLEKDITPYVSKLVAMVMEERRQRK